MHKSTKITEKIRKEIWKRYCEGWKIKDLALYYYTHKNNIGKIINRARKIRFYSR